MTRIRLALLTPVTALAVALAAGCGDDGGGGGGGGQSLDAQSYAADVCQVSLLWHSADGELDGFLAGAVEEPVAAQAVTDAQSKQVSFVSTIRAVEEPADEEGKAAYASLQATADSLDEATRSVRAEGGALNAGTQTAEAAARAIKPTIQQIYGYLRQSVTDLDAIATDADLTAIVRADQSCEALGL